MRRGAALGLAVFGLWAVWLTGDAAEWNGKLSDLMGEDSLTRILKLQLGHLYPGEQALTGLDRLVLYQSPLLAAAEPAILELRAQRGAQQEGEPDLPLEPDGDDREEPDLRPPEEEDGVVEMTAQGKDEGKYLYGEGVYLYNRTDYALEADVLSRGTVDVSVGEGPQILILHTHGSEAYTQSDGNT